MTIQIHNTKQIVKCETKSGEIIECRVWEGVTKKGVGVSMLIKAYALFGTERDEADFLAELESNDAPTSLGDVWPSKIEA